MNQTKPTSAKQEWMIWGIDLIVAILLAIAAAKYAYFPMDVALATFVQSIAGDRVEWARIITNSVSLPYNFLLAGFVAALAWWMAGWRAALLAIVSIIGMWLAEPYLKAMVARPRPAAPLVRVFGSPSGYSYPSGFGLVFFSLFGYLALLAWQRLAKNVRWMVLLVCGVLLLIGGCARVALGAHWPSDIYGAYLVGLVWTKLLVFVGLRNPSLQSES